MTPGMPGRICARDEEDRSDDARAPHDRIAREGLLRRFNESSGAESSTRNATATPRTTIQVRKPEISDRSALSHGGSHVGDHEAAPPPLARARRASSASRARRMTSGSGLRPGHELHLRGRLVDEHVGAFGDDATVPRRRRCAGPSHAESRRRQGAPGPRGLPCCSASGSATPAGSVEITRSAALHVHEELRHDPTREPARC